MKTKNEVKGYQYSNGSNGKKWIRGKIMFSEGKQYFSNGTWIDVIIKTDLGTRDMHIADLKEAKRFLTPEGYAEYAALMKGE